MRSRKLNKRVDIYQTTPAADGFGGNTVAIALIGTSWASISTLKDNSNISTEFGLLEASKSIIVTVRKRKDITFNTSMYLKYRGEKYVIKSYPNNLDFEDAFIKMICTKESD